MSLNEDDLFLAQQTELEAYENTQVAKLLRAMESARKDIYAAISEPESYTSRRLLRILSQLDEIGLNLQADLRERLSGQTERVAEIVQAHQTASISLLTGVDVSIGFDVLNTDVLKRFATDTLTQIKNVSAIQMSTIRQTLFTEVGVKGANPRVVARRLAGKDGKFGLSYGRLENIIRTETSTVYNAQSEAAMQHANQEYGLQLKKRIIEANQPKRNHPISRVLNNQVQVVGGLFRASVAEVNRVAASLKAAGGRGGTSGIFWPVVDGYYTGSRLPAHYRERGTMVPTERDVNTPDA